jgi:hypothetical protein
MQTSATVESKNLAGSYVADASALERQLLECDSQPVGKDIPKKTSAPESPTQGEKLNEAGAILQAHNGDAAAFECLYRLHSRRVYALCLRMVRDATAAEDLTQDAFLPLFRKIHTFRHESAFSTWLHRLTVNP